MHYTLCTIIYFDVYIIHSHNCVCSHLGNQQSDCFISDLRIIYHLGSYSKFITNVCKYNRSFSYQPISTSVDSFP